MAFILEDDNLYVRGGEAEHVVYWYGGICRAAARLGALDVLRWLQRHDNPRIFESEMWMFAAAGGSVDTLRWLRSHHCSWSAQTCEAACQGGSLPALKWLRRNGCGWDERALEAAIIRGKREMLTWLQENGAPFNKGTAWIAAHSGNLPTLTWLHQAGCPWTYHVAHCAVEYSHIPCLEFAIAHGCPWWPMHDAPGFHSDDILRCCWRLRAPLPLYALRRIAQRITITAVLCLVKGAVALPASIASDIVKLSIMSR